MRVKRTKSFIVLALILVGLAFAGLLIGSSGMSAAECVNALFGRGTDAALRIVRGVRLPRVLAAIIAGAGLSVSGLIMQTVLGNSMASPSTLGVSNAAVFGANLSIIVFAGGYLSVGKNISAYSFGANPYATGMAAFVFAMLSVLIILGLCRLRSFSPEVVVLAGIAAGSVWTAATTVLQFYATDVGLSAAVIWSFGDLGRATYEADLIMLAVLAAAMAFFCLMRWKYNALLSGEGVAISLGVNVGRLRFVSLMAASLLTSVCVSFLGIIAFVGIICPHIAKRLFGQDHGVSVPASALIGSILLLAANALSRGIGSGSALPVGAITSLLGAPFFIALILGGRRDANAGD